jgi:hypothetical protein
MKIYHCVSENPNETAVPERKYESHAQNRLKNEISTLKASLVSKRHMQDFNLVQDNPNEVEDTHKQIKLKEQKLHRAEQDASAKRAKRAKLKDTIQKVSEKDEEIGKMFKSFNRKVTGRPKIEIDQPGLIATILDIVTGNSAAEARRRCEILRTCFTLTDLWKELEARGYIISRSGTYLHILSKRCNTKEGLRHVETAPVKLLRPDNSLR